MKLYNTLSHRVEDFKPNDEKNVLLYCCGPTVYDYAHIGNLRSFVFDDTLRRTLEASGYAVKQVMNITDVGHLASDADEGEDKLEKGAKRENISVWQVADLYIKAFLDDVKQLNILPPNAYHSPNGIYPRATDFIADQLAIVKLLLDKGFAYKTEQAIYFDVTKLSDYGKLTGQNLADKETGARDEVVTDANKHHPQDFAVWFFKVGRFADHSMSWPSEWGEGFPGWHLECSAIIHSTLGEPLDIHTGGVDHIGTHHTNEIAQTEAAYGVELSRYWLHNEHLLVDGKKMAKSTGNFYTLKNIIDKGYSPLALRLLFLQSHYRSQTNFTWDALSAAQTNLDDLYAWADQQFQDKATVLAPVEVSHLKETLLELMTDDLNSPAALAKLNEAITKGAPDRELLEFLDKLFGLRLKNRSDITEDQKKIITERETARQTSDWQTADKLRNQLAADNIEVNDTSSGPIWYRKTKSPPADRG